MCYSTNGNPEVNAPTKAQSTTMTDSPALSAPVAAPDSPADETSLALCASHSTSATVTATYVPDAEGMSQGKAPVRPRVSVTELYGSVATVYDPACPVIVDPNSVSVVLTASSVPLPSVAMSTQTVVGMGYDGRADVQ